MIVNSHLQSAYTILHAARAFTIYRNQCSRSPEYAFASPHRAQSVSAYQAAYPVAAHRQAPRAQRSK